MTTTPQRIAIACALLGVGVLAGRAIATGVPTTSPLTWAGVVTDDAGKPYPNEVAVAVAFYDGQAASTPACSSQTVKAQAGTGYFEVVLPAACVKAVHDSADLWSEMTVGDGKTVLPRSRVGAVPYALEAGVASGAVGALGAEIGAIQSAVGQVESKLFESNPLKVFDATGLPLGRLLGTNGIAQLYILTKYGYPVPVVVGSGEIPESSHGVVHYDGINCTGVAFREISESYALGLSNNLPNYIYRNKSGQLYFQNADNVLAAGMTAKSSLDPSTGLCANWGSNTKFYKPVVKIQFLTMQDLGLPPEIKGPLKLK